MAKPNGKGGWDLTDKDVEDIMRVSYEPSSDCHRTYAHDPHVFNENGITKACDGSTTKKVT